MTDVKKKSNKNTSFYFLNDLKFKHVTFDEVEKVRPFKGKNPIAQNKV